MFFKDEVEVEVRAGNGGSGCVSFRREKYVPRGGPDGGDGGHGGNVVFVARRDESTLYPLTRRRILKAESGKPGGSANCYGKDGRELRVRVPVGTVIKDAERDNVLKDLTTDGEEVVVARAGRGGRGNKSFATATNRTPHEFEKGSPGEVRKLKLELKLIADVGLIGLPNAGKSTLLARVSAARPKIADYPFTTLEPQLGIVEVAGLRPFVMADIPGLIAGAHAGKGLGDRFLRHVERTRVLLHLVDVSSLAAMAPAEAHAVIRGELSAYSLGLEQRPTLVVATKMDDPASAARADELERALSSPVVRISAATGAGLPEMFAALAPHVGPPVEE
jgi:GTP-binding protein